MVAEIDHSVTRELTLKPNLLEYESGPASQVPD